MFKLHAPTNNTKLFLKGLAVFALVMCAFVAKPTKASALNCAENTSNINTLVSVQIINDVTGTSRFSQDFSFTVRGYNPHPSTWSFTDQNGHNWENNAVNWPGQAGFPTQQASFDVNAASGHVRSCDLCVPNMGCAVATGMIFGDGLDGKPYLSCAYNNWGNRNPYPVSLGLQFWLDENAVRDIPTGYKVKYWETRFLQQEPALGLFGIAGMPEDLNNRNVGAQFKVHIEKDPDAPYASLDTARCDLIAGWAFDYNDVSARLRIDIYFDGPPGIGKGMSVIADQERGDVAAAYAGVDSFHGFRFDPRTNYPPGVNVLDGNAHTVHVYAINVGAGSHTLLGPATLAPCSPPPPSPFRIKPTANKPVLDDVESPTSVTTIGATFNLTAADGSAFSYDSVQGIAVECRFFIDRRGNATVEDQPIGVGTISDTRTITKDNTAAGNKCEEPNISLSGPPLQAGDQVCVAASASPGGGTSDFYGVIAAITVPANSLDGGRVCETVVDRPFVSLYGGDVSAGGDFAGGGTCLTPADIKTFNKADGLGSGVQFAVQALGNIENFSSARLNGRAPDGLTFANVGTLGNFNSPHCIPDYFADGDGLTPDTTTTELFVNGLTTGNFKYQNGTVTLHGGNLANGVRSALYIEGNLYIDGPINSINYASDWNSIADIPSLHVYVKGNIYIAPGITNLVGFYVAQDGIINDCTDAAGTLYADNLLLSNCGTQLKVRGAFVANKVKLLRAVNSLRNAQPSTESSFAGSAGAEVFGFGPELYLVAPEDISGTTSRGYSFYTSLPPVL